MVRPHERPQLSLTVMVRFLVYWSVAQLRERTNYLRRNSGGEEDWRWVDVFETSGGGAEVIMGELDDYLETLEKLDIRMREQGIKVEMDLNPRQTGFILVDENNVQVPFNVVMKALFD